MRARLRWWIAERLNRNPKRCWTDLALWAQFADAPLREAARPVECARYVVDGSCYCGKKQVQP